MAGSGTQRVWTSGCRENDKGSASQAMGWTKDLLPAAPTALMPGTAWPPPSPRLCWLPAPQVGRNEEFFTSHDQKRASSQQEGGLQFLFPPPEVAGSQGSGFFSHTGQIGRGLTYHAALMPKCLLALTTTNTTCLNCHHDVGNMSHLPLISVLRNSTRGGLSSPPFRGTKRKPRAGGSGVLLELNWGKGRCRHQFCLYLRYSF